MVNSGPTGRAQRAAEQEISSMLESVRLYDEISDDKVDELASLIQQKLGVDLPIDGYREMAQSMFKLKLDKDEKSKREGKTGYDSFSTAPTWSQESASPDPAVSPKSAARARSPHRTRPLNIHRSNRSPSPNPAASCRERSRSPYRAVASPTRVVKVPISMNSPSVYHDARQDTVDSETSSNLKEDSASSVDEEIGRPPLASVKIGLSSNSSRSYQSQGPSHLVAEDTKLHESFKQFRIDDPSGIKFNLGAGPKGSSPRRGIFSPGTRRQPGSKHASPRSRLKSPRPNMKPTSPSIDGNVSTSFDSIPSVRQAFPDTPSGGIAEPVIGAKANARRTSTPFNIRSRIPEDTPTSATDSPFDVNLGSSAPFASPVLGFSVASMPAFQNSSSAAANGAAGGSTPKTPHECSTDTSSRMNSVAETAVKKKGRNTNTPSIDDTTIQFNMGRSDPKAKLNRGGFGTFRKGATSTASPSSIASMDIDGNTPPPPQKDEAKQSQSIAAPPIDVKFSIGVGGSQKSPSGKHRGSRRDKGIRSGRSQLGRNNRTALGGASSINTGGDSPDQNPMDIAPPSNEIAMAMIKSIREEGKSHFIAKDYRSSILSYTNAIKHYVTSCMDEPRKDLLAVLLSNRAAALLMVGAYQPSVDDCLLAIYYISNPLHANESSDGGPALGPKLYNRMGRALLKQGKADSAEQAFNTAITSTNAAMADTTAVNNHSTRTSLEQVMQEATIGITESVTLRETMRKLFLATEAAPLFRSTGQAKQKEALEHVNAALATASGCESLHEQKVALLASLERWREVASHCERLAASNIKLSGCFVEDLASKNPFSGVPDARFLDVDFFGEFREDELRGAELKLNSKAASEAVLRLPLSMVHYYVRSLRLEERYPAAEAAIRSLEGFLRCVYDQVGLRNAFAWLPQEQERLARTRIEREKADELFRRGDFSQACTSYLQCLRIDSDSSGGESFSGGGRLHAVLHCNRAACLMAQKRFEEALLECTAALRIHPRYMKALLRRARCYSRLDRLDESIAEFKRWMDFVAEAKRSPHSVPIFLSPCLFDGPHEISDNDVAQVKTEYDEVVKMKAKNEESARAEAQYRQEYQRRHYARSDATGDSRYGRDHFYSQHSSSRRWGSFTDRGSNSRPNSNGATRGGGTASGEERMLSPKSMATEKNHYKVLGLQSNASDGDIKKAFKKLALKYHPDKNKDDDAVDTFRRVKESYEILGDSVSRRKYDQEIRWRRA